MTTVLELRTFLIRNGRDGARFNPNHDKGSGKFASKGGGGGMTMAGSGISGAEMPMPGSGHHSAGAPIGAGKTADAADGAPPIKDAKVATGALSQGLNVHIDPVTLGPLTDLAASAPKSKAYDMSRIRVAGNEQAFEGLGLSRGPDEEFTRTGGASGFGGMPQIESQYIPDYVADLRRRGVKVEEKPIDPTGLKASQSQLDAQKAGGIKNAGKFRVPPGDPIIVTSDGYVVDGHHRWAAAYAANESVPAIVIHMPIRQGLSDATAYMNAGHGQVKSFGGV